MLVLVLQPTLDAPSHRHTFISISLQHPPSTPPHSTPSHTSTFHTLTHSVLQVAAGEEEVEASTAGEKEETDHDAPPPPVPQEEGPLSGEQSNISAAAHRGLLLP